MALRFNTAFRHDNGMLERRRSVIAARYCRGSFLFDLLATVPWANHRRRAGRTAYVSDRYRVPVLPMFRALRLAWMPRLREYLGKGAQRLDLYDMRRGTNVEKYVAAVYWAFSTLTTVGYGNIKASTNDERRRDDRHAHGVSW
ncbi:voltage-gated potassium channel [Aureococcus anophagefferens]|nr:voltage-gated potassium channel [Aureococcus anophagefferens]